MGPGCGHRPGSFEWAVVGPASSAIAARCGQTIELVLKCLLDKPGVIGGQGVLDRQLPKRPLRQFFS